MKQSKFITFISQNNTGSILHQRTGVAFALAVETSGSRIHCAKLHPVISLRAKKCNPVTALRTNFASYILHCAQHFASFLAQTPF